MNYSPDKDEFNFNLNLIKNRIESKKVMIGLATYNIEQAEILNRISKVRLSDYNGYVLFSYNNIKKNNLFSVLKPIN